MGLKTWLCYTGAVLLQLSYQANWELIVMRVYDKPTDDGYVSIQMMLICEIHVF